MSATETKALVERLRELAEKATPGAFCRGSFNGRTAILASGRATSAVATAPDYATVTQWDADATLIVELRNALPQILAALEPLTREPDADEVERVAKAMPDNCDGKEQHAFEAWAKSQGFDMHEHPLHYLFLDPKTDAARSGWSACIRYCREQVRATGEPGHGS